MPRVSTFVGTAARAGSTFARSRGTGGTSRSSSTCRRERVSPARSQHEHLSRPLFKPEEIHPMKILREFRRFLLIKSVEGRHADIRSHVFDNITKLALGFHVSAQTIVDAVEGTSDDQT